MGTLRDLTGRTAATAAERAAATQAEAGQAAIEETRAAREQARADLAPFREAGQAALPGLTSLVTDPEAQRRFVEQNPFFNAMIENAQRRIFQNQAARGKVGSGGTAEALQQSVLGIGSGLVGQGIAQQQGLASLGANAAAGQANITTQAGGQVGDLLTQIANAQAAGQIGAANARQQGLQQLLGLGLAGYGLVGGGAAAGAAGAGSAAGIGSLLALSDRRMKKDITEIGQTYDGLPLYKFKYKGDDKTHINVMAQDVEKVKPDAVIELGGVKLVNMEKVYGA